MKQFELQTPIACSEQSNRTHNFRKIIFCDVITLGFYEGFEWQTCWMSGTSSLLWEMKSILMQIFFNYVPAIAWLSCQPSIVNNARWW